MAKKGIILTFVIEYSATPEDLYLVEALEKLRETGSAEVIDARVETNILKEETEQ